MSTPPSHHYLLSKQTRGGTFTSGTAPQMKTTDIAVEDMVVAGNVVLKRTARVTVEYGTEEEAPEYGGKKHNYNHNHNTNTNPRADELAPSNAENKPSTSGAIGRKTVAMDASSTTIRSRKGSAATLPRPSIELVDIEEQAQPFDSNTELDGSTRSSSLSLQRHDTVRDQQDDTPINFGQVIPGVFRSSFPKAEDYPFFKKLGLKTVVTLVQKDFPADYKPFLDKSGIRHHVFDMEGTKKQAIPVQTMNAILRLALDRRNYPLLIHCNHGRHRTGCVVAAIRKLHGWHLDSVLDEYRTFAEPKIRECDVEYISALDTTALVSLAEIGRPLALRFNFRRFGRTAVFTALMLVIWAFSGSQMMAASDAGVLPLPTA